MKLGIVLSILLSLTTIANASPDDARATKLVKSVVSWLTHSHGCYRIAPNSGKCTEPYIIHYGTAGDIISPNGCSHVSFYSCSFTITETYPDRTQSRELLTAVTNSQSCGLFAPHQNISASDIQFVQADVAEAQRQLVQEHADLACQ